MDLSKFKTSDWLLVGGGLGFLIFGTFFNWIRVSLDGLSDSGGNAFDFFFTGTIPWILVVGSGVIAFLVAGNVIKAGTTPWPIILLAATGLATLLNLIRLVAPGLGEDIPDGLDVSRAAGLWLSFLSTAVALAGAVLKFSESGGSLDDLTDVNRLKRAFDRDTAPPPPPPPPVGGATPPPPPPPGGGRVPPPTPG